MYSTTCVELADEYFGLSLT